ncbi:MAG TPA: tetratricopeptide repeat protein, partial [Geobacteraceae bacterium]|nr:tetratricopeptide repeat protein [Geobacteraceae bacterium]
MIISVLFLSLSLPVHAASLYPLPDNQLAAAAIRLKEHNYKSSREIALTAPHSGLRDFLLGMTAYKAEDWPEAATHLSHAADSFPLLADYALYNEASALYRLDRFSEALAPLQRVARDFPN